MKVDARISRLKSSNAVAVLIMLRLFREVHAFNGDSKDTA